MNYDVVKEILTTKGVNSKVMDYSEGVQKYKTIGHIGLFDFDGVKKSLVLEETKDLPGISILFESSEGSFHIYNLCVRDVKEIAILGLKLHCDCKHISHGYKVGKWVLRIAPKWNGDKPYKPAPKYCLSWFNETELPQSKAHWNVIRAIVPQLRNKVISAGRCVWGGVAAQTEEYMTVTDQMKGVINNG